MCRDRLLLPDAPRELLLLLLWAILWAMCSATTMIDDNTLTVNITVQLCHIYRSITHSLQSLDEIFDLTAGEYFYDELRRNLRSHSLECINIFIIRV